MTRKEYMEGKISHEEYYGQFTNKEFSKRVARIIGEEKLRTSTDPHFNDIPLKKWDVISVPLGTAEKMKECGDYLTQAGIVCIAKLAARQFVSG